MALGSPFLESIVILIFSILTSAAFGSELFFIYASGLR